MPRKTNPILTEREGQVMEALWTLGEGTADDVRRHLADDSHASTVRTILKILVEKGYVLRSPGEDASIYRPAVAKLKAQRGALKNLVARFFSGSADALLLRIIEDEKLTPEKLERLRKLGDEKSHSSKRRRT